jgi:alkylation response protein AidB-like acyl-CoA dehydrogenase
MIMAYVSRADCQIVDTWRAGGLRGTGSHDVVVEDVRVPADHCVWFLHPLQLTTALYRMPFAATLSAGCASICLGIARGALETLTSLAATKILPDRGVALRDQPALLARVARMQSQLASARLLLHHAIGEAWQVSESGRAVTLEQRANVWQAALHAAGSAKDVVRTAYEAAGSSALYESCPLERAHRDLHAVMQHVIVQELWLEESGRVALGIPPLSPMFLS